MSPYHLTHLLQCEFSQQSALHNREIDTVLPMPIVYDEATILGECNSFHVLKFIRLILQELEAAKSTFQNIISSFTTLNFPLAYYGLGRIHYRQNRSVFLYILTRRLPGGEYLTKYNKNKNAEKKMTSCEMHISFSYTLLVYFRIYHIKQNV